MVRLTIRISIAFFTAAVFLLVLSVFLSNTVSTAMAAAAVGVMLVSYFRPGNGLLLVAAFAPIGAIWSPLIAPRVRGAETLVLAFLAGALIRRWTLDQFRQVRTDRLAIAGVTFAAIVGVSCLREIWMSGMGPAGVLDYAARQYITNLRGLGEIYAAMLLLEGIALLFFAARQSCEQKDFGVRLIRTIVISSVAAASFNFLFFAGELMETGEPWARLKDFFLNQRWSSHVGDVNAAGSYFAMTTVIALGLFLLGSKHRLAWLVAGAMTGLALWMTASRTALIAVLALAAVYVVRLAAARSVATTRKVVIGTVLAIALAAFGVLYSVADTPGATSSTAVSIRWMFLQTTGRMLQAHPFAGVGIGQYGRWSAVFSSPELKAYYPRENAHNNFAQIAGELGLPGFTAFLAVIGFALFAPTRQLFSLSVAGIAAAALVVFMISWLGGHPLLVAEVSYPFWLILGVAAGTSTPTREATQGWT